MLPGIMRRVMNAVREHFRHLGVNACPSDLWPKLFVNPDHIIFDDFDHVMREVLPCRVSRYETRVLWMHLDEDRSGVVRSKELADVTHRVEVNSWDDINDEQLFHVIEVLTVAAEKWHSFGGNWIKVFREVDGDCNDRLNYEELRQAVRGRFPAMLISQAEMSEAELQGFWRRLDEDRSSDISIQEFMAFMRKHGPHPQGGELAHAARRRFVLKRRDLGPVPHRTPDELREIASCLDKTLQVYWARNGCMANTMCRGGHWSRFMMENSSDSAGKLVWQDFKFAITDKLAPLMEQPITIEDLYAFWAYIDMEDTGEATNVQLVRAFFRLELDEWRELDSDSLDKAFEEMHTAMIRWHRADGNWYKMFNIVDADDAGRILFEDLWNLVRSPFPCLAIPHDRLPDPVVQALWKAMDHRRQGYVKQAEFMQFMRKKCSVSKPTQYTKRWRQLATCRQEAIQDLRTASAMTEDRLYFLAGKLSDSMDAIFARLGVCVGQNQRIAFPDFEAACRVVWKDALPLEPGEWKALWRQFDCKCTGFLGARQLQRDAYKLSLEGCPKLSTQELAKIASLLDRAAQKWHGFGGDFSKVLVQFGLQTLASISFADLTNIFRCDLPGLAISLRTVTDQDLRGLWRHLDALCEGLSKAGRLTEFVRQHSYEAFEPQLGRQQSNGGSPQVGRQQSGGGNDGSSESSQFGRQRSVGTSDDGSSEVAAVEFGGDPLARPPPRTRGQMELAAAALTNALKAYLRRNAARKVGLHAHWEEVFEEFSHSSPNANTRSRRPSLTRINFQALQMAMMQQLAPTRIDSIDEDDPWLDQGVEPGARESAIALARVSREDLQHLWALADDDCDGLVSAADWRGCLCRLSVDGWPKSTRHMICHIVEELDMASTEVNGERGNWQQIFSELLPDLRVGAEITFDDFCRLVRLEESPCLGVPELKVSDDALRAFWKALDTKRNFQVPVDTMLRFIRQHQGSQLQPVKPPGPAPMHRRRPGAIPYPLAGGGAAAVAAARAAERGRNGQEVEALGDRQRMVLSEALGRVGVGRFAEAFQEWDLPWLGLLSEFDVILVVRKLLNITEDQVSDDQVFALWQSMKDEDGLISVEDFAALGQVG